MNPLDGSKESTLIIQDASPNFNFIHNLFNNRMNIFKFQFIIFPR